MFLRTKDLVPPGGWRYKQPETGHWMSGTTFRELVSKVATHRDNQRIATVGRLEDEVEEAVCAILSPEDQHSHCRDGLPERKSISWKEVDRFLKTMAAWAQGGGELVPQGEAERRAAICKQCPLNVGLHGCAVCRVALDAAREKLLQRETSLDADLRACGVCGCDNKLQVHVPLNILQVANDQSLVYPSFCWKKQS